MVPTPICFKAVTPFTYVSGQVCRVLEYTLYISFPNLQKAAFNIKGGRRKMR
jgi:hypothetical protein